MRPFRFALAFLLLAACGSEPISGSVEAWVIARRPDGVYDLQRRSFEVDDLERLEGSHTAFTASAKISAREDATGSTHLKMVGGDPMSLLLEEKDGAWFARDFHSLMGLTIYHHLSASHAWFRKLGLGTEVPDVPLLRSYYQPSVEVVLGIGLRLLTDNAGYTPMVSSFLFFEQSLLDEVPLAANEGVITHEYAHAIFHHLTGRIRGVAVPEWMDGGWPNAPANALRAIDEGLADVHGAASTGDPNFIAPSASALELDRNLAVSRKLTPEMLRRLNDALEDFDPYVIGSVVASTFWDWRGRLEAAGMGPEAAREAMARGAFQTARTLPLDRDFTLPRFLTTAIGAARAEERTHLCAAVRFSFADLMSEVSGCE